MPEEPLVMELSLCVLFNIEGEGFAILFQVRGVCPAGGLLYFRALRDLVRDFRAGVMFPDRTSWPAAGAVMGKYGSSSSESQPAG